MRQLKIQTSAPKRQRSWIFFLPLILIGVGGLAYSQFPKQVHLNPSKYVEAVEIKSNHNQIPNITDFEKQLHQVNWKQIDAKSIIALNPNTGKIYYSKNQNEKLPIASITKLMTVLTAQYEYENNQNISLKTDMPKMDNPVGLKVGDSISVSDLYKCALIESNNDCANTFAYQYLEGYEQYILKMNEYAQVLGMTNSHFSNPTGFINTDNYSTATDLGKLASAVVRNQSIVIITDKSSDSIKIGNRKIALKSTNLMLMENKNIKGLKTGFTYASGECLVLYYDFGNDEKLVTVVLDASDRFKESRELYNLILKAFN